MSYIYIVFLAHKLNLYPAILSLGIIILAISGLAHLYFLKSFFFFLDLFLLFYVDECFDCMKVCVPHMYLVPMEEVRRVHQVLWNRRYRWL